MAPNISLESLLDAIQSARSPEDFAALSESLLVYLPDTTITTLLHNVSADTIEQTRSALSFELRKSLLPIETIDHTAPDEATLASAKAEVINDYRKQVVREYQETKKSHQQFIHGLVSNIRKQYRLNEAKAIQIEQQLANNQQLRTSQNVDLVIDTVAEVSHLSLSQEDKASLRSTIEPSFEAFKRQRQRSIASRFQEDTLERSDISNTGSSPQAYAASAKRLLHASGYLPDTLKYLDYEELASSNDPITKYRSTFQAQDPALKLARAVDGHLADLPKGSYELAALESMASTKYGSRIGAVVSAEYSTKSPEVIQEGVRQLVLDDLALAFTKTETLTTLFGESFVQSPLFGELKQFTQQQANMKQGAIWNIIGDASSLITSTPPDDFQLASMQLLFTSSLSQNTLKQMPGANRFRAGIFGGLPTVTDFSSVQLSPQDTLVLMSLMSADPDTNIRAILLANPNLLAYIRSGKGPVALLFKPLAGETAKETTLRSLKGFASLSGTFLFHTAAVMSYSDDPVKMFSYVGLQLTMSGGSWVFRKLAGSAMGKGISAAFSTKLATLGGSKLATMMGGALGGPVGVLVAKGAMGFAKGVTNLLKGKIPFKDMTKAAADKSKRMVVIIVTIVVIIVVMVMTPSAEDVKIVEEATQFGLGGGPFINCTEKPDDPMCNYEPCDPGSENCSWPTTCGRVIQGPFQSPTHTYANAIDIAMASCPLERRKVYFTFEEQGTVIDFRSEYSDEIDRCWPKEQCTAKGINVYGNYITIQGTSGRRYKYGHLSRMSPQFTVGDIVQKNQGIGVADHNGLSGILHLHVELVGISNPEITELLPFPGGRFQVIDIQ